MYKLFALSEHWNLYILDKVAFASRDHGWVNIYFHWTLAYLELSIYFIFSFSEFFWRCVNVQPGECSCKGQYTSMSTLPYGWWIYRTNLCNNFEFHDVARTMWNPLIHSDVFSSRERGLCNQKYNMWSSSVRDGKNMWYVSIYFSLRKCIDCSCCYNKLDDLLWKQKNTWEAS